MEFLWASVRSARRSGAYVCGNSPLAND
jgi:hypothetical protein